MKKTIIKCPHCGAEYLPEEILFPEDCLGKPRNILKSEEGKIEFYIDEFEGILSEYQCDYCDTKFKVEGQLSLNTTEIKDEFEEDYKIQLW